MSNQVYTYTYIYIYIYMCVCVILLTTFISEPELLFGTQLNGFKYCYITQFNISHLFAHSFFYWNQVLLPRLRVDLRAITMKEYSAFPKSPGWSFAIKWFNVICMTLADGGGLTYCRDAVSIFYSPSRRGYMEYEGDGDTNCSFIQ